MRFYVRRWTRVRFSVRRRRVCAGEEKRILRKSAFCGRGVTEKRILRSRCDGKVHSATETLRKSAFCVAARIQSALFRKGRADGSTPHRLHRPFSWPWLRLACRINSRFRERELRDPPRRTLSPVTSEPPINVPAPRCQRRIHVCSVLTSRCLLLCSSSPGISVRRYR